MSEPWCTKCLQIRLPPFVPLDLSISWKSSKACLKNCIQWVINKNLMRHSRNIDFLGGGGMCLQEQDEDWTGKKEKPDRSDRTEEDE